ncbi:biotin--[acetyl-CoA-carboxylase] ligase [uncultured Psychrobacter sp.]|uniref:biotin--[acetyl-CoA-carboxylase] ligase n=1 Tax=uncultured Psychrobacter sp. TaxID=259303 RepID=UPI00345A615F
MSSPTHSVSPLSQLNYRHVDISVSTNSELIEDIKTAKLNKDQVHLLTADTQTAGRGQRARSWQSPRGNVYLSLYHPMQEAISGLLSLIVGVELAKMPVIKTLNKQLSAQGLMPIGVKWANDLGFYQPKGLTDNTSQTNEIILFNKLAGILIEPVWQAGKLIGVVMGVGLNVQTTPKLTAETLEGMSYQALSLQDIHNQLNLDNQEIKLPSLQTLYQQISTALLAAITCFKEIAVEKVVTQHIYLSTQATDEFLRQFATLDALAGWDLRITQTHNDSFEVQEGKSCGIDTNGCLQLQQDNGKISTLFTGRIDVINDR